MNIPEIIAISIILMAGLAYLMFSLMLFLGLARTKQLGNLHKSGEPPFVSVVVAARNEANHIERLLLTLASQSLSKTEFEVVVIDDGSIDDTAKLIREFARQHPDFQLTLLQIEGAEGASKKSAVAQAIRFAKGPLIVSTDADCHVGPYWLKTLRDTLQNRGGCLLLGPVTFEHSHRIFERMQALEFLSLIGAAAATAGLHRPILSNAANLAFSKDVWIKSRQEQLLDAYASGDDMELLFSVKKNSGPAAISFVFDANALVYTSPAAGFKTFMQQRIRWASKAKATKDGMSITVALFVFIFHLILIVSPIVALIHVNMLWLVLNLFMVKLVADFPLMLKMTAFVKQRNLMWYYLPVQGCYPLYIVLTALLGLFGRFQWKGRIYPKG